MKNVDSISTKFKTFTHKRSVRISTRILVALAIGMVASKALDSVLND